MRTSGRAVAGFVMVEYPDAADVIRGISAKLSE